MLEENFKIKDSESLSKYQKRNLLQRLLQNETTSQTKQTFTILMTFGV